MEKGNWCSQKLKEISTITEELISIRQYVKKQLRNIKKHLRRIPECLLCIIKIVDAYKVIKKDVNIKIYMYIRRKISTGVGKGKV